MRHRRAMKVGDLVRMKNDDVLGMIMGVNTYAEPLFGACWNVFFFEYNRSLGMWETQLEVISEGG